MQNNIVRRPEGTLLTRAILPPADTRRWVASRKLDVVLAVRGGLISLDDACQRYALTVGEFLEWQRALDVHGPRGLTVTTEGSACNNR